MQAAARQRREIAVRGIVQGVGFRPFIYALARRCDLAGWVRNDSDGVTIQAEGAPDCLDRFLDGIARDTPPLAVVESLDWRLCAPCGERGFRIETSRRRAADRRALISPDVGTCDECLAELFDPADRRYRYPFINCTNCGPRFTITRGVPYDRALTTMAGFAMCAACRREYDDPADRRFHAQPNACPACGPRAALLDRRGCEIALAGVDAVAAAAGLLRYGAVVAIKGLGGYHLACDPFHAGAVRALRERKARQDKPFALMARDLDQVRELCDLSQDEEALLCSSARPIVLLTRRADDRLAGDVAPRQKTLGVMLAYTPLHHLLLRDAGVPLVMTSGNRSDEPIAYRDDEALHQLVGIADAFLVHDRQIHMRCDDTVARVVGGCVSLIRRSRGYAPRPLPVTPGFARPILSCGAELKSTFCLARDDHAFVSHHIGDLDNYETLCSYREGIEHYARLFDVRPALIACDMHPEYLSTKYAREREEAGIALVAFQHHHAHIASCLADNERPRGERVIGVAMDGTGYGGDGQLWGGEFFTGSIAAGFERRAHLRYLPLPGGESAIRQPWRAAVGALLSIYDEDELLRIPLDLVRRAGERQVRLIARMVGSRLNSPLSSSAGRLFDVVGALLGVEGTDRITYEGQAAVELELIASPSVSRAYPVRWLSDCAPWTLDTTGMLSAVVGDLLAGEDRSEIAGRFHRAMSETIALACERLRLADGIRTVALSGGTFQNALLLTHVTELLEDGGFTVYRHRRVPSNDGGLCLGQAVLADQSIRSA